MASKNSSTTVSSCSSSASSIHTRNWRMSSSIQVNRKAWEDYEANLICPSSSNYMCRFSNCNLVALQSGCCRTCSRLISSSASLASVICRATSSLPYRSAICWNVSHARLPRFLQVFLLVILRYKALSFQTPPHPIHCSCRI